MKFLVYFCQKLYDQWVFFLLPSAIFNTKGKSLCELMLAKQIIICSNSSETMMCHYLAQLYFSPAWFTVIVFFPLVSSPFIFLDLVIIYLFGRNIVMISVSKRRSNLHAIPSLISSLHPMDINTHPHMVMAIPSLSSLLQCLDTCTTILLMRHYIRYVLVLLFMRINRSDLSPWILEHKQLLKWWTCLWLVRHFF